jgi:transcriptional regulator with XRE-family HTH domain
MPKPAVGREQATRPDEPEARTPHIDHKAVGARLRQARRSRELTLAQLSDLSGIAVSTISKAERGDIALTYDKFVALAHALNVDFDTLFQRSKGKGVRAMEPTLTRSGKQVVYDSPNYEYGMIANELVGKRMVPMRAYIRARRLEDFPEYIRHEGEEFVFLLQGRLELHFENGSVFKLEQGDSLYFDSAQGHVYISAGQTDAEVLVCCVDTGSHRPPQSL